jgi:transglutaminase-like putative cysteine protease
MRRLVQQGKWNPATRDIANQITATAAAKDWVGELAALFYWVRENIRYSLDPNDLETIQGAEQTLSLGYGDCDDIAILLATLCECAGHPCCFVALAFYPPGDFSHVVVIASAAGESEWICLDATEQFPFGWFPPGATSELICPITAAAQEIFASGA